MQGVTWRTAGRPWTAGLGVNVKYLGAVGWQPTALIGNNAGHEQQDLGYANSRTWGQREVSWGCRLATYSTYRQQCCRLWTAGLGVNVKYLGAVGWQPTALIGNNAWTAGLGVNVKYLGAVGWQPTALIGNNAGYEQQGWGQHEVSWGCRLATYSTYGQQCGLWTAGLGSTWCMLGL